MAIIPDASTFINAMATLCRDLRVRAAARDDAFDKTVGNLIGTFKTELFPHITGDFGAWTVSNEGDTAALSFRMPTVIPGLLDLYAAKTRSACGKDMPHVPSGEEEKLARTLCATLNDRRSMIGLPCHVRVAFSVFPVNAPNRRSAFMLQCDVTLGL